MLFFIHKILLIQTTSLEVQIIEELIEDMSWKKNFSSNMQYSNLPSIGAFKVEKEPEDLGKGKYKVQLIAKDSKKYVMNTYEATIGDIVSIPAEWVEAYEEKVGKNTYIRFRAAK